MKASKDFTGAIPSHILREGARKDRHKEKHFKDEDKTKNQRRHRHFLITYSSHPHLMTPKRIMIAHEYAIISSKYAIISSIGGDQGNMPINPGKIRPQP